MKGWLFREPLSRFLARYDEATQLQVDLATPKLKKGLLKTGKQTAS
jgi:hypothetical protein